jgi:hypothetical protein
VTGRTAIVSTVADPDDPPHGAVVPGITHGTHTEACYRGNQEVAAQACIERLEAVRKVLHRASVLDEARRVLHPRTGSTISLAYTEACGLPRLLAHTRALAAGDPAATRVAQALASIDA